MKIVEVEVWKQNLKLTKPYSIANHYFDAAENIFVKVILENGMIGIGAGSPSEFVCNEPIDESLQLLKDRVDDLLLNKNILNFYALLSESSHQIKNHPAALASIDIALHDAYCKLQGIRIVDFYGVHHQRLPTSITLTIMSLAESKKEVQSFLKQGFKVVKVKIGEEVSKDIDLCKSIHGWTNGNLRIRVDGNQGYNPEDLNMFLSATRDIEVEFIEQPLARGSLSAMSLLTEEIRKHCMADEDLHGPEDALTLLGGSELPFGLFNIKLMKCGGIARGKQIAQMAAFRNINLMWGCMDESVVSISAALHLAYASPNTRYLDLDGHLDLTEDVARAGFRIEDGHMLLNDRPGLGVDILK